MTGPGEPTVAKPSDTASADSIRPKDAENPLHLPLVQLVVFRLANVPSVASEDDSLRYLRLEPGAANGHHRGYAIHRYREQLGERPHMAEVLSKRVGDETLGAAGEQRPALVPFAAVDRARPELRLGDEDPERGGEDTLRTLLEEFRNMLQGSAQTHMEKLADALAKTSEGMEQIRAGLTDAANRMATAAGQISEQMGRNAEQAMAGITRQMEALVGELRTLAEQSRAAGNDAMAQAADRIAKAGESFGGAAQAIATSLEQTVQGITTRLGGEAEAATRKMTEELTNAIAAMRELAERNRSAGDESARAMSERIAQAATSFEQSAAKVAEALTSGAGDAAGRLTGAVEQLRDHFVKLTGDLAGDLETAGSQFAQQGRDGATALTQAAEVAASALRTGGQESGEALRAGGTDASRGLQAAVGELSTPLRELGQRIVSLQNEALQLGSSLTAMQQAVTEATALLRAAAADMAKQGVSGQKTAADLATAAQRIAPLADAMTGAMQQLGEAERRLAALSQNLDTALGGFKGLDASLGRVFKDLGEGLGGFTRQVADFVKHTNDDMAKAVNTLSGAVTDLSELYDDGGPPKRGK